MQHPYTYRATGQATMATGQATPVYTAYVHGTRVATVTRYVPMPGPNAWGATALANGATGAGPTRGAAVWAAMQASFALMQATPATPATPTSRYRWQGTATGYRVYAAGSGALVGVVWQHAGVWHAYNVANPAKWRTGPTPAKALHAATRAANKAALRQAAASGATTGACATVGGTGGSRYPA